nr:FAD-dependent oxidoreductase [Bacillus subtilis]
MNQQTVNVIGAGLAGSEAAWQLAKRGIQVKLYEMRYQLNKRLRIIQINLLSLSAATLFALIHLLTLSVY